MYSPDKMSGFLIDISQNIKYYKEVYYQIYRKTMKNIINY